MSVPQNGLAHERSGSARSYRLQYATDTEENKGCNLPCQNDIVSPASERRTGFFGPHTQPRRCSITFFDAILLGVLQGITEFLPVSSSGHLVIMQNLFGLSEPDLFFDTMLHVGTLVPVLWVFRQELFSIARGCVGAHSACFAGSQARALLKNNPEVRMVMFIVIASIPTGLIGLLFKDVFAQLFSSVGAVGVSLLITGTLLLSTKWYAHPRKSLAEMTAFDAVAIGVAQGLAITPGISRSGSTIATALLLGVNRELAGRFSFLIFIPAICGALLLNSLKLSAFPSADYLFLVAAAALAACVTGCLTLVLLLRFVRQGKLYVFSPYCYLLGIGALVFAWLG